MEVLRQHYKDMKFMKMEEPGRVFAGPQLLAVWAAQLISVSIYFLALPPAAVIKFTDIKNAMAFLLAISLSLG